MYSAITLEDNTNDGLHSFSQTSIIVIAILVLIIIILLFLLFCKQEGQIDEKEEKLKYNRQLSDIQESNAMKSKVNKERIDKLEDEMIELNDQLKKDKLSSTSLSESINRTPSIILSKDYYTGKRLSHRISVTSFSSNLSEKDLMPLFKNVLEADNSMEFSIPDYSKIPY